jgi:hypothetical protein
VTLYYKPHNSAIVCTTSDGCYNPPTTGLSTPPPADWMCFHTDRVATCGPDNQNVSQGSSILLQWTSIPTTGTTCNTSGSPTPWPPGGPNGGEGSGSGTLRFDPPTFGTYTFRLNCTNFLGSTLTKTIVITTPAPTPIVAAGTGVPIHGCLPPTFCTDSSRWILLGTINPNNGLAINSYYFRIGTANPPTTNYNCSAYGAVNNTGTGTNAGTCSQTVPFSGGAAVNIREMVDIGNTAESNRTRIYYQLCAVTSAATTCSSIVNFVPHNP